MNGILQLLVYPLLNKYIGSEELGVLLYIMGLVAIVCPSVGQALNTSRLVVRRDYEVTNGDYNRMLFLFGGIGTVVSLWIARESLSTVTGFLLAAILIMVTVFRYYGDVEYRLNLNYPRYFLYYAVLSIGYLLGFGLYFLTKNSYLVFLTGEILALGYLALTGTVFQKFFVSSSFFQIAFTRGSFLVMSYFITNLTLNIDRLALKHMVGDLAVTQYYVTSLIGKTMVLLVAPVNTIIISYLTKREENLSRKQFMMFVGAGALVSMGFFVFAQIGTPLYVRLFYKDLYESVRGMMTIVNITQILGLFSAYLFIVVLTFTGEKWQLGLQVFHLVLMGVLVLLFTPKHGIMGFAAAVLAANIVRVFAVTLLGIWKAGAKKETN